MERSKAVKCRRRRSLPFCLACFLLPLVSLLRGSPLSRFLASAPCHTRAYLFISLVPDAIKFTLENHALYMNDLSKFDPSSYHTLALLSLASPLENNLLPKRVFVFFRPLHITRYRARVKQPEMPTIYSFRDACQPCYERGTHTVPICLLQCQRAQHLHSSLITATAYNSSISFRFDKL